MGRACPELLVEQSSKEMVTLEREVEAGAVESSEQIQSPGAPSSQTALSRARTVSLVVTLTGVSFKKMSLLPG